ncbi:hypothetical protein C8Q80DRAFT_1057294, partial [Daedaleopsis nitida]
THFVDFELTKTASVGFTRRHKPDPGRPGHTRPTLVIAGQQIKPSKSHKYIGVIHDQELRFHDYAQYTYGKGSYTLRSCNYMYLCRLYLLVTVPQMLYAVDVWGALSLTLNADKTGYTRRHSGLVKKLSRIQRQVSTQALRAMFSTATDMLDAHANLLPLPLLVNKLCTCLAVRMSTLPKAHPLCTVVQKSAKCLIKHHQTPLHHLMHGFEIDPPSTETVLSVRRSPRLPSPFTMIVSEDSERAVLNEEDNTALIKVFSDGSVLEGGVGGAAVLVEGDWVTWQSLRVHLGSKEEHTIFDAENVGLVLALEL